MRRIVAQSIVEISYRLKWIDSHPSSKGLPSRLGCFIRGLLCGSSADQVSEHAGHLHVLRKGRLKITRPDARQMVIDSPLAGHDWRVVVTADCA
jgi:hypothetical protein